MSPRLENIADTIVAALGASALRATAILIVAVIVVGLWRRASAAHRHTIWLASLVAIGIAVLQSLCVPELVIRFAAPPRAAAIAATLGFATPTSTESHAEPAETMPAPPMTGVAADTRHDSRRERPRPSVAPSHTSSVVRWQTIIASVWLIGLSILILRLIGGCMVVSRAGRRLRRAEDPLLLSELESVESTLGSRQAVTLVLDDVGAMPRAQGIRHAKVVIPANAYEWTPEKRRAVMLHEVAHAVRGDVAAQIVADAACALLWFHPLIWLARQELYTEAERAADDVVLRCGIAATTYARQLLDFARMQALPQLITSAAVSTFANSNIEQRFAAMLDSSRSRSASTPKARRIAASLACVVGAALAACRVVTPAATQVATLPAPATRASIVTVSPAPAAEPSFAFKVPRRLPATDNTASPSAALAIGAGAPQEPDLSGTWTADSAYAGYRMLTAKSVVSIEQTADTIHIVRRGPMPDIVGKTGVQDAEFRFAIPLDGTAGKATLTYAGSSYDASVSGAWRGGVFVTTITGERSGFPWGERDRWSLKADRTLALAAVASVTTYQDPSNAAYFEFTTSPTWEIKLLKRP